jgi:hypothetical protein
LQICWLHGDEAGSRHAPCGIVKAGSLHSGLF